MVKVFILSWSFSEKRLVDTFHWKNFLYIFCISIFLAKLMISLLIRRELNISDFLRIVLGVCVL